VSDLVNGLRERAKNAREEGNATANADAWHFEASADEIDRLRDVIADLIEVLIQAEDYLDKRADSEDSEFGPVPNAEMSLLTEVQQALAKAEGKS
jgi:hypothetical protein